MGIRIVSSLSALFIVALAPSLADALTFRFDQDTVGFANMTVFEYQDGIARVRRGADAKKERYTRRCFVLSRTSEQFVKFARFEPRAKSIDDVQLAQRIRQVTRIRPWLPEFAPKDRIVIPAYANLRALSKARARVVQDNVGLGWPTYWRIGNYRIFAQIGKNYQRDTHQHLEQAMARRDLFVAYLTTLPNLSINHSVLVYKKQSGSANGDRYLVYDPNHPEAPRELKWNAAKQTFEFQKDWDFVGGPVRVYQVYGKPWQ